MPQEFLPEEFLDALREGQLRDRIVLLGMVKEDAKNPRAVLFAPGAICNDWISLSVEHIEKIEFIRNVSCKDHNHPLVRIHLKYPTDNPEAEMFSQLLSLISRIQQPSNQNNQPQMSTTNPQAGFSNQTFYPDLLIAERRSRFEGGSGNLSAPFVTPPPPNQFIDYDGTCYCLECLSNGCGWYEVPCGWSVGAIVNWCGPWIVAGCPGNTRITTSPSGYKCA